MKPADAIARIRRFDRRLNAYVRVFDPPLFGDGNDGVTVAIKDLIDVAGTPTGGGARVPLDPAPARHAIVVGQEWPLVKLKHLATRTEESLDHSALASKLKT